MSGFSRRAINGRSYPDSNRAAGAKTGRGSAHEMPRWVKLFAAVAALAVIAFAVLHLTGGGMGHLAHGLTHGDMGAHGMPAERGHHIP